MAGLRWPQHLRASGPLARRELRAAATAAWLSADVFRSVFSSTAYAVLVLGCTPVTPEPLPPSDVVDSEMLTVRMEEHFEDVEALKNAVLIAELETVREVADWFVERNAKRQYPVAWHTSVLQMVSWAEVASRAEQLDTAATAVARLSAACGSCHREQGAKPAFGLLLEPGPLSQMELHRFAVDRMWEGLVGPSDERWSYGAEVYGQVATCRPRGSEPSVPPYHAGACNTVVAVAGAARSARTEDARVAAFADVIRSCSACHGETARR